MMVPSRNRSEVAPGACNYSADARVEPLYCQTTLDCRPVAFHSCYWGSENKEGPS
jgi:hypothetical protein